MATHFLDSAICTGTIAFVELSKLGPNVYSSWVNSNVRTISVRQREVIAEKQKAFGRMTEGPSPY